MSEEKKSIVRSLKELNVLREEHNKLSESINATCYSLYEAMDSIAKSEGPKGVYTYDLGEVDGEEYYILILPTDVYKLRDEDLDKFMVFLKEECYIESEELTVDVVKENKEAVIESVLQSVPNVSEKLKEFCDVEIDYVPDLKIKPKPAEVTNCAECTKARGLADGEHHNDIAKSCKAKCPYETEGEDNEV